MAMDGQGNRLGGGEWGGSSHVSYKPYGEVQRNDSQGPDIFRYKYTGQEEDRETGLYYYKARYYDPEIGRFTQADSILDTRTPMSMDLFMYTEGNPVNHTDPSGHSVDIGTIAAITFPTFSLPSIGAAAVGLGLMASVVVASALAAIGLGATLGYMGLHAAAAGIGAIGIAALSTINSLPGMIAGGVGATFAYASGVAVVAGIAVAMGFGFVGSLALMMGASALEGGLIARQMVITALGVTSSLLFTLGITAFVTVVGAAAAAIAFAPYTVISIAALAIGIAVGLPLYATIGWTAFSAVGSVLSPFALQGYIAGGLSKSSFNNVHWDEKSARLGGCYGAAVTFGGLHATGLYLGYNGLVLKYAVVSTLVQYASYTGTAISIIKGDWKSVGADATSYAINAIYGKDIPIGLGLKYAEGASKFCEEKN
ncbi:RHS repeat-associated core domain-containing protein [Leptospira sp. 201903070]|uniref:RHS repeat-associated core domain-containing protein n=2 Tax=Leptospira ainlahdjerensis TaxID=2810033 RepID=A0ABS2UE28_9LEPT|nr:RHS repeat-associated core domain-containing protein [Leptospira ainlahdjerensis]